jgi:hypothetical protein
MDLMPTILHYLGLPVPKRCDGQVRRDVFLPESEPAQRPATFYVPAKVTPLAAKERDDGQVLGQLRALGYID